MLTFNFNDYGKAAIRRIREVAPGGRIGYPTNGDYSLDLGFDEERKTRLLIESDDLVWEYSSKFHARQFQLPTLEGDTDQILTESGYYETAEVADKYR